MSYLGTKPQTATEVADGVVTPSDLSTGHPTWDTSGNVGIGTSSPASKLNVQASSLNYLTFSTSGTNKLFVGVDNGTPELVVGASAGDSIIRTQQQLWFGLNGGGVAGRFDSSGNFYMNSGYGSAATAYGCRAWVNFNGTGTVAITGSGNVSSITDTGTGSYTVNFTNSLPDTNYSVNISTTQGDLPSYNYMVTGFAQGGTVSGTYILCRQVATSDTKIDLNRICVAVFR